VPSYLEIVLPDDEIREIFAEFRRVGVDLEFDPFEPNSTGRGGGRRFGAMGGGLGFIRMALEPNENVWPTDRAEDLKRL
jgi:hypothetical protein